MSRMLLDPRKSSRRSWVIRRTWETRRPARSSASWKARIPERAPRANSWSDMSGRLTGLDGLAGSYFGRNAGDVALPCQCGPDHFLHAVMGRLPAQNFTDAVGAGDKSGRISGPARGVDHRQGVADHRFDRSQDFANREAPAIGAVDQQVAAVGDQMAKRQDMGIGQIG